MGLRYTEDSHMDDAVTAPRAAPESSHLDPLAADPLETAALGIDIEDLSIRRVDLYRVVRDELCVGRFADV